MKKSLLFATLLAFGFQGKAQEFRKTPENSSGFYVLPKDSLMVLPQLKSKFPLFDKQELATEFKPFYDYKLPIVEITSIDTMPVYRPDANALVPMPNVRPDTNTHFHLLNDDKKLKKPR